MDTAAADASPSNGLTTSHRTADRVATQLLADHRLPPAEEPDPVATPLLTDAGQALQRLPHRCHGEVLLRWPNVGWLSCGCVLPGRTVDEHQPAAIPMDRVRYADFRHHPPDGLVLQVAVPDSRILT